MENKYIRLIPADTSLADQLTDYYIRNRQFLQQFEPERDDSFFTAEFQKHTLKNEMLDSKAGRAFRFYIKPTDLSGDIIGVIGLGNVVWGAFCSAFLGYKLDEKYIDRGYMTMAISMLTGYAFDVLHLHRIEANVMPKNRASLRVLEKNGFQNEGISKYYLRINGAWEDHIHMVKINHAWAE